MKGVAQVIICLAVMGVMFECPAVVSYSFVKLALGFQVVGDYEKLLGGIFI